VLKEQYQKNTVAIRCLDRHSFYKIIKWLRSIQVWEKKWKTTKNNNASPVFHHTYRNTIYIDWRYKELDIGAHFNYKNVLEYKDVIEEEDLSENYNDCGQ